MPTPRPAGAAWTGFDARRPVVARLAVHVRPGSAATILAISLVLAYASLAVPAAIGYDPWAWLGWGREATQGRLRTEGGPTWKPFPVLVTTPLAYLGDAAPEAWLLFSRTGGLFAMGLAGLLAARFAGPVAGVVAGLALLLTPDDEARWTRLLLQGNIEPLTVGLCLWAVLRHLDGHRGQAFLLGGAAALMRPEAGPLLVLYGAWLLVAERSRWRVFAPTVALVLIAVPLLWLGGDWFASGDPLTGAVRAQVLDGSPDARMALATEQVTGAVIAPVWVAAAVAVVWSAYRRQLAPVVLAGGALLWMGIVVAMAVGLGFAALSRFLAPSAAILCVLAGIAAGWMVTAVDDIGYRLAAAFVLVLAVLPFAAPRVEWLPVQLAQAAERGRLGQDLSRAIDAAGGPAVVLGCGRLAIEAGQAIDQHARPALSWELDQPLAGIGYALSGPGVTIVRTGSLTDTRLSALPASPTLPAPPTLPGIEAQLLARNPGWSVFAVGCPVPAN